ncbi:MAG TPA: hypothetical protein VIH61_02280 [Waddliaceae bacterium]
MNILTMLLNGYQVSIFYGSSSWKYHLTVATLSSEEVRHAKPVTKKADIVAGIRNEIKI